MPLQKMWFLKLPLNSLPIYSEAIRTHFFNAIRAFTQLELMRVEELIENWYELQRNLRQLLPSRGSA
ncbi:MAG: hypothetical protein V7K90_13380 [Nostoc sp.]